ncbi:MAG: alanine--glyoxylate aminotransferase family protein [Deferribacteres bacterium]|nr:alanine--glyoxylate aminotransferase family protein [candidate division KSB1 bacterium]MCB9511665.1 alanine--glyoxylate aminotransferase family protein [Deferribacteres bacterium]
MRPRLFTPGPTQIPERVIAEMSQPLQHHRSPEFKQIFAEVSENLKQFFRTAGEVLTLTTSGSGAMESAVVNLLSKGDKVISIEGGKFGERWGEICRAYGLQVVDIQVPWGDSIPAEEVRTTVRQHSDATAVFMTHSETSTGVAFDVKGISEVVHAESDALLIVDGITSIGVLPFEKDQWHIDVAVSGSQKGVMIPPGLAFIALNDRAWDRAQNSDLPKYYLSLLKARKALAQQSTPFTPATTLLIGLRLSLEMILADGLPSFWEKYARLAHATREGAKAVGLELFASTPSNALTAIKVPDELDGHKFVQTLREKYRVTVAGGQSQLKGKIFRVAHMGYYDHLDMVSFASAMEMALQDLGWRFELGKGVAAVQIAYATAGK